MEKISEKYKCFTKFSSFARGLGKIRNIICICYNGDSQAERPEARKVFNDLIKKAQLENWKNLVFKNFTKMFRKFVQEQVTRIFYCSRGSREGRSTPTPAAFNDFSGNRQHAWLALSLTWKLLFRIHLPAGQRWRNFQFFNKNFANFL